MQFLSILCLFFGCLKDNNYLITGMRAYINQFKKIDYFYKTFYKRVYHTLLFFLVVVKYCLGYVISASFELKIKINLRTFLHLFFVLFCDKYLHAGLICLVTEPYLDNFENTCFCSSPKKAAAPVFHLPL